MESKYDFYPSFIDAKDFRFIIVDGRYVAYLMVKQFPRQAGFIEILESLPKLVEYEYSLYVKKQDTDKILKLLTYSISSNRSEMESKSKNQVDVDILDNVTNDGINIRKEIQLNNEEIFYISFIFGFYADTKDKLMMSIKDFQSKLYSKNIISNILNFRHLNAYISTLPLVNMENLLFKSTYKNLTTSNLANIFPFYTRNYIDKFGVLLGYTFSQNRVCFINMFDKKYLNSNLCVFGCSGSGKSYFIKLLIIRNYFLGRKQFIIDPEGEYTHLVEHLSGEEIDIKTSGNKHYNLFEILKVELEDNNFFEEKITKITRFIIDLMDEEENKENYEKIYTAIKKSYMSKGISEDKNTILKDKIGNNIYLKKTIIPKEKFPSMNDLYNSIEDEDLKFKIKERIMDKYNFFCGYTNIEMSSKIVTFNLKKLNLKESVTLLKYFYDFILKMERFETNTIIYFDELWKYVCSSINISSEIFTLFKTIRKKNAGIVSITQDISDFFNLDNGNYGKSILNNSNFKVFFKMQYADIKKLESLNIVSKEIVEKLSCLSKGNMFLKFSYNELLLKVNSSNFEKELLKEENYENNSCIK